MDAFEAFFRSADLNQDGKISGQEAVSFFQGANLPQQVLAQIWMYADQNKSGFLGRPEFFNALKLVTVAQSGRALTPEIVKSALYGPASAKIPAPQINSRPASTAQKTAAPAPRPQSSSRPMPPSVPANAAIPQMAPASAAIPQMAPASAAIPQMAPASAAIPHMAPRPPVQHSLQPAQPRSATPTAVLHQVQVPAMAATPTTTPDPRPSPGLTAMDLSVGWPTNNNSSQAPAAAAFMASKPEAQKPPQPSLPDSSRDANVLTLPESAFSSISPARTTVTTPSVLSTPGIQNSFNFSQLASLQSTPTVAASPGQLQSQWPKISQSDILKYRKVFEDVDKDHDGRITGAQARTLFLSWRLPREVLKQVWDLSDQDSDGMLTLREFCVALYLMERHRAGLLLPDVLPDSLRFDETLLQTTAAPSAAPSAAVNWQQNPGVVLPPRIPGANAATPAAGVRPALMQSYLAPQANEMMMKSGMPKASVAMPVIERSAMSLENHEAANLDQKVPEADKQILDSKEKLEFYRNKMQDLVLCKSRCDNRLNEITERASADKREVESLSKKYEEKYKQVGEVASKLAVEEAAFRDVQERKQELLNAITKMEQGGSVDGLLQVRADRIQYHLEEMEKALIERCKHFGVHVKESMSIELPTGWQPGRQEGAMDWDEDWDKFEDEGFLLTKTDGILIEDSSPPAEYPKPYALWADDVTGGFSPTEGFSSEVKAGFDELHHEDLEEEEESGRRSSSSPFARSQLFVTDTSPHSKDSFGGDFGDESAWKFDDTDSVWGSSTLPNTDSEYHPEASGALDSPTAASDVFAATTARKSLFFEESVPSSPAFASRLSDVGSSNYGRFDSFQSQDSGVFPAAARSSGGHSRFDSFDDADPFGSTGPFKASSGTRSPRGF